MKPSFFAPDRRARVLPALLLCLCASLPLVARAEKSDRAKPINVEADRMQYDDLKQINVFTGNVTLTKGSIVIKADRLVIRQDPEGYQYGTAYGNPASFRQKRDGPDQFVEGYGVQLDYDGKTEVVTFRQKATIKRLEKDRVTDEVYGNLIVYESLSEFMNVESGGAPSATAGNPGGRVRVVIQPKNTAPPGSPSAPPPAAPVRLRPDEPADAARAAPGASR
jgi:lipopolysaccharide export system protein LptA